jgi:hypothetical protein
MFSFKDYCISSTCIHRGYFYLRKDLYEKLTPEEKQLIYYDNYNRAFYPPERWLNIKISQAEKKKEMMEAMMNDNYDKLKLIKQKKTYD